MELSAEEVCPTEDTILALLEFLVDPLLPSKCLPKDQPLSHEDLVAKQVHAVVLLYNYYHRKQNPGLEFLEFISFCKLAVGLKPSLLSYLSFMQRSDYGGLELDGLDDHMSLTEKEVVKTCDVSRSLDASNEKPVIEGWPISKVAVFLVDSKKENCFLFHSSITQGVWSVIEKEVTLGPEESANKKKRVIKKTPKENQSMDEASLQQAAYLAVKEACAFSQGVLKILESHTVYSTNKAKTAVRLYIMRCTNSNQDENLVPISDAMASLKGPLVKKESGSWLLTPVIEYFHLLPFADEVSDWLSRSKEIDTNDTLHVEAKEDGYCYGFHTKVEDLPPDFEEGKDLDSCNFPLNEKLVVNTSRSLGVSKDASNSNNHQEKKEVIPNLRKHREDAKAVKNGSTPDLMEKILPRVSPIVEQAKDIQNGSTSYLKKDLISSVSKHSEMQVEDKCSSQGKDVPIETVVFKRRNRSQKNICNNYQGNKKDNYTNGNLEQEKECPVNGSLNSTDHGDKQKQIILQQQPDKLAFNGGAIVVADNLDPISDEHNEDKVYYDQDEKQDRNVVSYDSNFDYLHKVQLAIVSKENSLSRTALNVLHRKREQLSQQVRMHADEVAMCDRKIEIILKGGKDDLDVIINSMIEHCNDSCLKSGATDNQIRACSEDPDLSPPMKRKRLSEANLSSPDPCQMLDSICKDSNWTLPTYSLSTLEGGFKASVTVKGDDFECSSEGTLAPTPQNARSSAALFMLTKLQSMQWQCSTTT